MITDDQSYLLIAEINMAFTPAAPVDSKDLFAGRKREIEKVIGTVFQPGQHAVIYGERGVGKTSLANTLFDLLVFMGSNMITKGLGLTALMACRLSKSGVASSSSSLPASTAKK